MDFNDTPQEAAFRAEARAWLDANAERLKPGQRRESPMGAGEGRSDLLKRAQGRTSAPDQLEAIVRAGAVQAIFSAHDVLGALARDQGGTNSLEVSPGGEPQREQAIRLAVNVALYVLCSNYKDDQVHAEHIMRRRGGPK